MTKTIKLHKLANAIRDYRGAINTSSGKWVHAPKITAWPRVAACLDRLELSAGPAIREMIDGFKTQAEMNKFLDNL